MGGPEDMDGLLLKIIGYNWNSTLSKQTLPVFLEEND